MIKQSMNYLKRFIHKIEYRYSVWQTGYTKQELQIQAGLRQQQSRARLASVMQYNGWCHWINRFLHKLAIHPTTIYHKAEIYDLRHNYYLANKDKGRPNYEQSWEIFLYLLEQTHQQTGMPLPSQEVLQQIRLSVKQ